jgi:cell division transport system ATP-binding protein
MSVFRTFNQVGVTVLIATHDESIVAATPGRVLHLRHGELTP